MTSTQDVMRAMFDHHIWATVALIDALDDLPAERLDAQIPGTYGSIVNTLNHLVDADSRYLLRLNTPTPPPAEDHPPLPPAALRTSIRSNAAQWGPTLDRLEAGSLDATIDAYKDEYPRTPHAEGLLLSQAIHHGNDHRTQICSTLGALGLEVPELDVWEFWLTRPSAR